MTEKIIKIMTKDPIVLKAPASRTEALKLMASKNVTALPIIDSNMKFLGIVSRQDIFENPKEEQIALIMSNDGPKILNTDTVVDAVMVMSRTGRRHVAVVNRNKKLEGIVTPTDLLKIIINENISTPVESIISKPCIPIYMDVPLRVIFKTMTLTKLQAFPVVDSDANLVGIITDRDIINTAKVEISPAMAQLGLGEDEDAWSWEGIRNILQILYVEEKLEVPVDPVKEYMVRDPVAVYTKMPISRVAKIMLENDFNQVPVKNAYEELIAMVYDLDIVQVLMNKNKKRRKH